MTPRSAEDGHGRSDVGPEPENWQRAGFGLYVHWPFCLAKCPYCDFNSHTASWVDAERWRQALLSELDRIARPLGRRRLSSIFFGGGTPSLMPPELVGAIIERAAALWTVSNDLEVTLEANPTSVEASRLAAFRAAGVNRVSLGLQALDDAALRRLGRGHDAREAREALLAANGVFERVSADLIYARQDQTVEAWERELREALALTKDHLSLYQLTIEPGTMFARRHRAGRLPGLPDEDRSADLFEVTQAICEGAGRPAYEVSNHAGPTGPCRHNLIYWRGGDWAAIGPGAHARVTLGSERWATSSVSRPGDWLASVEGGRAPLAEERRLGAEEVAQEYLLTALRLSEGVDRTHLRRLGFGLRERDLDALAGSAHLRLTADHVTTTDAGRQVLDAILGTLSLEPVGQQGA